MTTPSATEPHTIVVVGVDFSPSSDLAVREALRWVRRDPAAELHLVHVLSEREGGLTESGRIQGRERLLAEIPPQVRRVAAELAGILGLDAPPATFGVHVRIGSAARVLVQLSVDVRATLIMVGTHGRGPIGRLVLGSVAQDLVGVARCPVLVVREQDYAGVKATDHLEPPCPACEVKRRETAGATWWCDVHARPHVATHIYSSTQAGASWSTHDSEISAIGVDASR